MVDNRKPNNESCKSSGDSASASSYKKRRRLNRSQGKSTVPTLRMLSYVSETDDISTINMEFSMTIRAKISNLTVKQRSILLAVLIVDALVQGVDFSMYLLLEYLYFSMLKSGYDPIHIKNDKVRRTMLLAELVIADIRGNWLTFAEREDLSETVIQKITATDWLPTQRTFDSWYAFYDYRKFFEIRIVPIESAINRDKLSSAERYSGYTKGYGNDGSPASPGKTKPNPELDGEDSVPVDFPIIPMQDLEHYVDILNEIEGAKVRKRQKR